MIPPVLLAEDDENDVLLIKRAFEKSRLVNSLQVACDGEVAVAYLSGEGIYRDRARYPVPVAMLLDLKLPRKSGLEVLAWVKQQARLKRMPIIILTSSREARDVQQAYDLGVNSYLVKPFTPREFTEMLNTFNVYWLVLNEPPEIQRDESRERSIRGRRLPAFRVLRTECGKGPDRNSGRRRKHRAARAKIAGPA